MGHLNEQQLAGSIRHAIEELHYNDVTAPSAASFTVSDPHVGAQSERQSQPQSSTRSALYLGLAVGGVLLGVVVGGATMFQIKKRRATDGEPQTATHQPIH